MTGAGCSVGKALFHQQAYRSTHSLGICTTIWLHPIIPNGNSLFTTRHRRAFQSSSRAYSKSLSIHADSSISASDQINPPARTRPPPLILPENDGSSSKIVYWFRVGRAYGKFYWVGLKAAWRNHQESAEMRQGLRNVRNRLPPKEAVRFEKVDKTIASNALCWMELRLSQRSELASLDSLPRGVTRADFQALTRDKQDFPKLPLFLLMFCLFGEYLPFIVPFLPGAVPQTCHIPKQVKGMRQAQEDVRRASFARHNGVVDVAPAKEDVKETAQEVFEAVAKETGYAAGYVEQVVVRASREVLVHYSASLGLHGKMWDRLSLSPPAWLTRRRVGQRFMYLLVDDLLAEQSAQGWQALSEDELRVACVERGIDVLEQDVETLRERLAQWQRIVRGQGNGYHIDRALSRPSSRWTELLSVSAGDDKGVA